MQKNDLYTDEEIKLFESLEQNIDKNKYKPLNDTQLEERKNFLKQIATNTIQKSKKFKNS